ncbi:beta-glucosidase/6-phospho-beta-glucosidase/beta-galactosidase [Caulobacter sp. AP07]|uniref:glycoside hydrolase family 1 protein n=1 Tax=Caulobacter sp. AP07 TaxID=1144304 RepID=UPI0002720C7A|nr:family 1 glycosylhydrolase [Caulobacter sp. AP07]EJL25230.1 beta-glucosidase/6-phospho-beta-glucosidase/beta-galactosidase [Caulobacter sp. AP07]
MTSSYPRPVPEGFLWGTAISAHQSEGANVNSDVWLCENVTPTIFAEPSFDACDSYHRYGEDIAIAADLGFNCHRIGIEWARIEPEPGQFSIAALDHYRRVLEACHARGLKPMVTYNHFTVPSWFAARGGFEVADGADLFARFAGRATEHLGDLISYASTFNEANIQRLIGLLRRGGDRQKGIEAMIAACAKACGSERFSSLLFAPVEACEPVLLDAHAKAVQAMKAGPGDFPVGLTLTMQDVQGVGEGHQAETLIDMLYGPWLEVARAADFVGVQTYTRVLVGPQGQLPPPRDTEMTGAGYEFYPQALGGTIRLAHERIGRPIYVTESGVATHDDARRIAYLDGALAQVRQCLDDGIDVKSFICWSLLDNFEWTRGYEERFGLVHVDYETFARTPKPSARHLGAIARAGLI